MESFSKQLAQTLSPEEAEALSKKGHLYLQGFDEGAVQHQLIQANESLIFVKKGTSDLMKKVRAETALITLGAALSQTVAQIIQDLELIANSLSE